MDERRFPSLNNLKLIGTILLNIFICGIAFGQLMTRLDAYEKTQTEQAQDLSDQIKEQGQQNERIMRLETQFSSIMLSLEDIKKSIKDLR